MEAIDASTLLDRLRSEARAPDRNLETVSQTYNSVRLYDLGEIQAIDANGVDRIAASQHYANRTKYTFKAVKTTVLVKCSTGVVLDIHCSMTQLHESQVGWQLLRRNPDTLSILTADKGYDWWLLRNKLRFESVKPLIRAREFGWAGMAENVLMDDRTHH